MKVLLERIKIEIYDKCGFVISQYKESKESKDYEACSFMLDGKTIICRSSKITPKKNGQFITCWKRIKDIIEPLHETDKIDFLVINVIADSKIGQFVFPKSLLIEKGIISTISKNGKLAFRVYPLWDTPGNNNAKKTQEWQLKYFYEIDATLDIEKVIELYN